MHNILHQRNLLEVVFKNMHYEQKKQCKLACHLWNRILGSGIDAETITIRKKFEFDPFIKSAQGTSLACKTLMLCHYRPLSSVAKLFPNLKFFVFKPVDEYNYPQQNQGRYINNAIESFLGWHQHLEVFINNQNYSETLWFLTTGVFQTLTVLALGCSRSTSKSRSHIIFSLSNAPNLQVLQLHIFQLRSHDIHILHTNVIRLHTLILYYCSTVYLESASSPITLPVNSMKKLSLVNADTLILNNGELLKLMVSKYFNLKYLSITTMQKDDAWESVIPPIIHIRKLVTLKINTQNETPNLINDLKKRNAVLEKSIN